MNHTLDIVLTALLWGAGGAIAAWLVTWPLRRRSQTGVLISVALVATGASAAAVVGNTQAMFLTMDDEYVTVTVAVGMVAPAASAVAAALDRAPGHPDPALVVPSVETVATAEVAVVARSAAPFLTTAAASRSTTVLFTIIP